MKKGKYSPAFLYKMDQANFSYEESDEDGKRSVIFIKALIVFNKHYSYSTLREQKWSFSQPGFQKSHFLGILWILRLYITDTDSN